MKVELWPISRVRPYDRNPRKNEGAVKAVAASLKEFGFRQPIVVDAEGVIVVGDTRWKAAKQLGLVEVPVHVADPQFRRDTWVLKECRYCSDEFLVRIVAIQKSNASGNFCSRPCYYAHLRTIKGTDHRDYKLIDLSCDNCGTNIQRSPSRRAQHKNHFCSMKCRSAHHSIAQFRGGHKGYRGSEWRRIRKIVLQEQPFCALCGRVSKLQVHHITPYRMTKNNLRENLIALCRSHHGSVDAMVEKAVDVGATPDSIGFFFSNILRTYESASRIHLIAVLQRGESIVGDAPVHQTGEGGSIPTSPLQDVARRA